MPPLQPPPPPVPRRSVLGRLFGSREGSAPGSEPATPSWLEENREAWDDLAVLDPFWATITYDSQKFGRGSREEYMGTGEQEIRDLLVVAERLHGLPRRERALDFGCGLGRLTRVLARTFAECHGVDISPEMVARARELHRDVPNATFGVNGSDLAPFADASFDFIYSNVTLEHVPRRDAIEQYIREFVRTLRPGGFLAFQLPTGMPLRNRIQARRRIYALLKYFGVSRERLYAGMGLHPIRMHHIPEPDVVRLLESCGARVLEIAQADYVGVPSKMYYVTKPLGGTLPA